MNVVSVYTYTDSEERAEEYRSGKVITDGRVMRDPGDFGSGLYADTWHNRAKMYGRHGFRIEVDRDKLLYVESPYNPDKVPSWLRPLLFEYREVRGRGREKMLLMRTVNLSWEERLQASKEVREAALKRGYGGIYTKSSRVDSEVTSEYVLFSDDAILSVTPLSPLSFEEASKRVVRVASKPVRVRSYARRG